jgi:hypothetical protein
VRESSALRDVRCLKPEMRSLWLKGCVRELLNGYCMKTKGVERSVNGKEKCYRKLDFIFGLTNTFIVCLLLVDDSLLIY